MKFRHQVGAVLCGVALGAVLVLPAMAGQRPANQPARPQPQPQGRPNTQHPDRPPQRNDRPPAYPQRNVPPPRVPPQSGGNRNENRPPANSNHPENANRVPANPYRQQAQNPQQRLQNMTPADRQRLAQREEQFRHLPPAQQQQLRDSARVWQRMTPEQRDHIRNDVLPKWKEMSPQRQAAIQHRLAVLQNMPEDARNRHLSDPSFTRGMSDEDKDMLRDLSHQHVASAPEPPPQ